MAERDFATFEPARLPVGNIFRNSLTTIMLNIANSEFKPEKRTGTEAIELRICEPVRSLTALEEARLGRCEEILEHQLAAAFEAGAALMMIRDEKLYRATHKTFESYCQERWGFGRVYAWRVIGAAERVQLLPANSNLPKPVNEFQVRPFLKLEPKVFPKAWELAVRRAIDGKVTPKIIRSVVIELSPKKRERPRSKQPSKRARALRAGELARILVLLQDVRGRVERGDQEAILKDLDDIEAILFGSEKPSVSSSKNSVPS